MAKESFQALLPDGAVGVYVGTGTPEGAVPASTGSIFLRKDGASGTSVYFKESGASASGWVTLPDVPPVGSTTGTVAAGDDPRFPSSSPIKPTAPGVSDGQVVFNSTPITGEPAGWIWSQVLFVWLDLATLGDVPEPHAPAHPVAVQGPTDPANLYAIVTWDRNDAAADGYNVYRDGVLIGNTADAGDPDDWDKRYFKDTGVSANTTHRYQVTATDGADESALSRPYDLHIRASDPANTFDITDYAGATVRLQLAAALVDARACTHTYSSPAVILFPADTYDFVTAETGNTFVAGDHDIILRGEGMDDTILRAAYAGSGSEAGTDKMIIKWGGTTTGISGLNPSVAVARGDRLVTLEDASSFAAGDTIWLNNITSTNATALDATESYDAWDVNYVTSVVGNVVHVRNPWAKPFPITASVNKLTITGCGVEQMTLEGQSDAETGYYTLLQVEHCRSHSITECRFKWFNRNAIYWRGYNNRIVACEFTETDPRVYAGESQRYIVSSGRGSHGKIIANTFGDPGVDSSSMVTNSVSHRQVVRHNQFLSSVNYGWNSHGAADYWDVVENNYFFQPNASKGGLFLGNTSFVYAGPVRIRGNLFDTCAQAAISAQQNSYQMIITDNWFRDMPDDLINWFGAALPTMAAGTYGSARSVVRRNQCDGTAATRGFIFGYAGSFTPFLGVSDLIIDHNEIDVDGQAIVLGGSAAESGNFQVYNNTGDSGYEHPPFEDGDYWADNQDAIETTGGTDDATPFFADTFGGSAGSNAGWPFYVKNPSTGVGIGFLVSSSGNYGRLSTTSAATAGGGRKNVIALRSEIVDDSVQLVDLRNSTATTSRKSTIIVRQQSGTSALADRYRLSYEYGTGVTNRLKIEKVISGTVSTLVQTTSFDAALTHDLRVRFEATGTTLRAKAWDAVSGSEPGAWDLTITDSSITNPGRCGLGLDTPDAQTSVSDFDNYKLVTWVRNAVDPFGALTPVIWDTVLWDWEIEDGVVELI